MREENEMKAKNFRSASRLGVLVGAAWMSAGCAYPEMWTATDGTIFQDERRSPSEPVLALKASGAHDLPCAIDHVSVGAEPGVWAVSGCGWRVVYRVVYGGRPNTIDERFVLVSRSPSTPGADQAATNSGAGCSKDTDCKGERVCVQGQCADPKAASGSPAPTAP
jgi:hypothetical protein